MSMANLGLMQPVGSELDTPGRKARKAKERKGSRHQEDGRRSEVENGIRKRYLIQQQRHKGNRKEIHMRALGKRIQG